MAPLFKGSIVALITPFTKSGRVDGKKIEQLVEWQIASGTDGIVCCGTTGEALSLSESEMKRITEICVKTAAKRIPVIAGTGVSDTRFSVKNTERALKLGADGCLISSPYYNKPTEKGCLRHIREISKVGLPMIYYYNPGRSGAKYSAEGVAEICQVPGVVLYKDSSHDIDFIRSLKKLCPIPIASGCDDMNYDVMREGGVGAISVIGNIIPGLWKKMIQSSLEGKWGIAERLAQRCLSLCKGLFMEPSPQGIKYAMSWTGRCQFEMRLPLIAPTLFTQRELKKALLTLALHQFETRLKTKIS